MGKQSGAGRVVSAVQKAAEKIRRLFKTALGSDISLSAKDFTHEEMTDTITKGKKLTAEQADAIREYSGSAFTPINKLLYDPAADVHNKGKIEKLIKNIEKATNQIIKKPLTLWRGENIEAIHKMLGTTEKSQITDTKLKSLEGKVMAFKGFASTAYSADDSFHSKPVFVEISAPKGVRGRVITDVSQYGDGESELLLHNSGGLHFKKVYRHKKSGQIIIQAEYVYG